MVATKVFTAVFMGLKFPLLYMMEGGCLYPHNNVEHPCIPSLSHFGVDQTQPTVMYALHRLDLPELLIGPPYPLLLHVPRLLLMKCSFDCWVPRLMI